MQAANFDNWSPFIFIAGILALFTAGVFILGTYKVINMMAMVMVKLVMEEVEVTVKVVFVDGIVDGKSDSFADCNFWSGVNFRERRQQQGGERTFKTPECSLLLHVVTNFEPISRVKSVLKVRETIFILGLGEGDGAPPQRRGLGPRPPTEGEDFVVLKVKSTSRL